ncbi:glycogen debranching N-terminal domain-containing protein [Streptomyces sp. NPDC055400]
MPSAARAPEPGDSIKASFESHLGDSFVDRLGGGVGRASGLPAGMSAPPPAGVSTAPAGVSSATLGLGAPSGTARPSTAIAGAPSAHAVTSAIAPAVSSAHRKDPAPPAPRNAQPLNAQAGRTNTPAHRRSAELPPAHTALICVALPSLAISSQQGQLTGDGLEGFYRAGRRVLSRCLLRVAGREPVAVQARMVAADRARFVATLRPVVDGGPDPDIMVERMRHADGTERITLRSSATRPLRLPVEVALGTDLAELGAVAAGRPGRALSATVHDSGMRWSSPAGHAVVTADPPPRDALASAGLLRWEFDLPPGGTWSVELRVRADGGGTGGPVGHGTVRPLAGAQAAGDDARVGPLLRTCAEDLHALLLRDPVHPSDLYLAAGAPWRCGLAPAEALAAARLALPLGTRLAAGTLKALARTQLPGTGRESGMIPGPLRDAGPHLPPGCTGTEATLLFPALLAEARRWGLPEQEVAELLPTAERCLHWLRAAIGEGTYLADPGPGGLLRCETQAHAHRAALLGADLLDAHGRPGAVELCQWAEVLRTRFREDFWAEDRGGGRPAAARMPDGRLLTHLGSAAAHLLDTGLLGGGVLAPGLLDKVQTEQLARLLGGPALDSGWGLRSLGVREASYNPFGHRGGAVRVQETALAVGGMAAAGYEKESSSLLRGVLSAAEAFGFRLPEMYAGEQRSEGGAPLPHPAACRPAATAAAAGVQILAALAGIRPDAPAGTVTLRPMRSAPLGEIGLAGLRVAGAPFSVRVSRLGLAMVEEAADGLQLGV